MTTHALLLAVHIAGLLLWSAGILGGARLLGLREAEAEPGARTKLGGAARGLGLLGDIGIGLAIVGGVGLLAAETSYLRQGWMHAKLTAVLALLGLHGAVRARGVRAARDAQATFPAWIFPALLAASGAIVALAVLRPF